MLWLRILSSNACSDSVVSETLGRVEVEHPQQRTSLKYNHFVIFMVTTNISLEQNNNSVEPITAMNVLYFAVYLLLEVADWSPLRVKISKPKSWKPPLYSNPWPLQKPSVSATNFFFTDSCHSPGTIPTNDISPPSASWLGQTRWGTCILATGRPQDSTVCAHSDNWCCFPPVENPAIQGDRIHFQWS